MVIYGLPVMTLCSLTSGAWIMRSARSRPWDKGGPGHPASALRASVWSKNKGGAPPPPGPFPGSATAGGENTPFTKQLVCFVSPMSFMGQYSRELFRSKLAFSTSACTHNSWKDKVEIFLESYIGKAKRTLSKTASFSKLNFQGL